MSSIPETIGLEGPQARDNPVISYRGKLRAREVKTLSERSRSSRPTSV